METKPRTERIPGIHGAQAGPALPESRELRGDSGGRQRRGGADLQSTKQSLALRPQPPLAVPRLADLPDILTVAEAGRCLRLGRNSAYEAIRRGEIPSVRMGRRILVPRVALERLLATAGPQGREAESAGMPPQSGIPTVKISRSGR